MMARILIADDDLFSQKVIGRVLMNSRYEIVSTGNGIEALKYLEDGSFDIAIIDYHLAGKTAAQLITELSKADVQTKIIIITADDTLETERTARAYSAGCFFTKPVNSEDLLLTVKKILHDGTELQSTSYSPTATQRLQ